MQALETEATFRKRAPSFVRARLNTANGRSKHTDPLFLTRNKAYFVLYDAKGREVRRVLDKAADNGRTTPPNGSKAYEAVRRRAVIAAMDEVLHATRPGAEGIALLLRMVRDERAGVREDALWHIRRLGREASAALPALLDLLAAPAGSPKHKSLHAATIALGQMGCAAKPALPALMRHARSGSESAAKVLATIDPDGKVILPLLIEILDTQPKARIGASLAIRRLGPKAAAAVPALIRLLKRADQTRVAQFYAVQALGAIRAAAKPAVPVLKALAAREIPEGTKPVWAVEAEAQQALKRINAATR